MHGMATAAPRDLEAHAHGRAHTRRTRPSQVGMIHKCDERANRFSHSCSTSRRHSQNHLLATPCHQRKTRNGAGIRWRRGYNTEANTHQNAHKKHGQVSGCRPGFSARTTHQRRDCSRVPAPHKTEAEALRRSFMSVHGIALQAGRVQHRKRPRLCWTQWRRCKFSRRILTVPCCCRIDQKSRDVADPWDSPKKRPNIEHLVSKRYFRVYACPVLGRMPFAFDSTGVGT